MVDDPVGLVLSSPVMTGTGAYLPKGAALTSFLKCFSKLNSAKDFPPISRL